MIRCSGLLLLLLGSPVWGSSYWQDQPLTSAWQQYLQQSEQLKLQDQQQLQQELKSLGLSKPLKASHAKNFGLEAIGSTADLMAVLSYQTPSGGWSKRTDMSQPRAKGQWAGSEPGYIPTFDNGATSSQMRWLMQYFPQATAAQQQQIRQSLGNALQFMLQAQFPNGGFPQNYPLRGGYHDAATLNDHVMADLLTLLWDISESALFSSEQQQQAREGFGRGVQFLVKSVVVLNGRPTVWAAQHHPLTLAPVAARKFEQVSLVSTESAKLLALLLEKASDQPGVVKTLCYGALWLQQHQIKDKKWQRTATGSSLVDAKGQLLWARFYSLTDEKPVFFDRDGQTYSDVNQLSLERQQGYGWYQSEGKPFLKAWAKRPELQQQCAPSQQELSDATKTP
ncbi:pectate lyase [Rheinheimera marina]|uniref:Pectate lyase n=1 Tax=Rheinheimera marina TaxID=1774958 RepID=A0ABV9JPF0_9GAMM